MKIKVNNDWWKDLFDEIYLLTDARSVCDENLTRQEVNFLEKILDLNKNDAILDLCGGQGRHALELSRRGFINVTVLDYSRYLVEQGNKSARQEGLRTNFVQGDARYPGFRQQSFQFIIVMASSFGYFVDEAEDKKIVQEGYRLLRPGGTFLLDLPDRDYLMKNFKPFSRHKLNDDIIVERERELVDDIIFSRETVMSGNRNHIRTKTYCTRLYSPEKITQLLSSIGFSRINCERDFMSRGNKGDFGCMTNRMVVTAKRI